MTRYFMDSGLCRSYPATGMDGNPTDDINQRLRPGLRCRECGEEFKDGNVAVRSGRGGFLHWPFCPGEMKGMALDRIDGNPYNNERSNLRLVTIAKNSGDKKACFR